MGAHSLPDGVDPDAGNTDPSQLAEEFHPDELAEILARFQSGHGVHVDDEPLTFGGSTMGIRELTEADRKAIERRAP